MHYSRTEAARAPSAQLAAPGPFHHGCSWISRSSETWTEHLHRRYLLDLSGLRFSYVMPFTLFSNICLTGKTYHLLPLTAGGMVTPFDWERESEPTQQRHLCQWRCQITRNRGNQTAWVKISSFMYMEYLLIIGFISKSSTFKNT